MTIRDFKKEDYNDFFNMCRDFFSGDAVAHEVDPAHFTQTFEEIICGNPFMRGLIAEQDGNCAGYAQLSFTWSNEAGGLVVWLEELYVKPEFRGMQVGTQMISFIREAYRGKAARFRLEVTEENTSAIRLYTRLGFEQLDYLQMIIDE